jgi:GT2 family glycosyltransferase
MNKSGKLASKILSFGPDLIPQPGALFSLKLFQELGGLDSKYRYAFDYDLFLKLKKKGDPIFVNRTQASFRWHSDSLSVKDRKKSVIEAFRVRQSWRSLPSQIIHAPLELFVVSATYMAGLMLRRRAISNKAIGLH